MKTEKRRSLSQWQEELSRGKEELEYTRIHFGRLLHKTPRTGVRCLEWSEADGCIDIVFNNGTRKQVMVWGDSPKALMQDILSKLN